jgi:catechol 2,3-dioxygenase-like lactoylglutathione lyase family enzyme
MGHMGLRVPDLDAAVEFQREIVGMVESERTRSAAYLTCNERHHELILIQDRGERGYDHIGLEVPGPQALEEARQTVPAAGGRLLSDIYDGEPGIDRALRVQGGRGDRGHRLARATERYVPRPCALAAAARVPAPVLLRRVQAHWSRDDYSHESRRRGMKRAKGRLYAATSRPLILATSFG